MIIKRVIRMSTPQHVSGRLYSVLKRSGNHSFVYTSYVSVLVQTALKLGKQTVSFQVYNLNFTHIPSYPAYNCVLWHQLLSIIIFGLF